MTALARPRSNCTVNYRPVLSSERALQNNKPQLSKRKSQGERLIDCRSYFDFDFDFDFDQFWGVLYETVKYGREFCGTWTPECLL
jgi:hypothetical protein